MADTRRSQSTLATSLADNTTGAVTPQNVRDLLLSTHPEKVIQTGTMASEPASGQLAGDLYLPSDSFYAERWSGSAWAPWGPIFPMTKPVDGDFSWVNQGTSSVVTTNGGITLLPQAGGGAYSLRLRVKSAPATPYTITAAMIVTAWNQSFGNCGLAFRQSSDGKLHLLSLFTISSSLPSLYSNKFTDATTFNATYTSRALNPVSMYFLRIQDNGTNRICSWSADGVNFLTLHTVGRTDYLTANQVGFYADPYVSGDDFKVSLLSWKQE